MSDEFRTQDDEGLVEIFNSPSYDEHGIGLALSGGGYKAAAYHLGGLIRLNEVELLRKIDRIASVSGGSIAAGFLGLKWGELDFSGGDSARNFDEVFAAPLREFLTEANLDVVEGVLGLVLPFRSGAGGVIKGYRKWLFGDATLQDLPAPGEGPSFFILSTNYELNSLWRFSRAYAADYRVGMIDDPVLPLASVVAASSAFPPFFCPVTINFDGQVPRATPGADCNYGDYLERALLADGGIYDNMGLEPIWKRFGTLLVSNAGSDTEEGASPEDWFRLLLRINGMIHRQAENNRQRMLMMLAKTNQRRIAYWPLRNDGSNYPVKSPVQLAPREIRDAQDESVRLWSLGNRAFARLANQGYGMCDAALRSYLGTGVPVPQFPYPEALT